MTVRIRSVARRRGDNVLFQFFRTQQTLRQLMASVVAGTGIKQDEYAVLGVVGLLGPLPPSELAARTNVPATTISRYTATFVERGLATRRPNPEDGRSYLVEITPSGMEAVQAVRPRLGQALRELGERADVPLDDIHVALLELDTAARRVVGLAEETAKR